MARKDSDEPAVVSAFLRVLERLIWPLSAAGAVAGAVKGFYVGGVRCDRGGANRVRSHLHRCLFDPGRSRHHGSDHRCSSGYMARRFRHSTNHLVWGRGPSVTRVLIANSVAVRPKLSLFAYPYHPHDRCPSSSESRQHCVRERVIASVHPDKRLRPSGSRLRMFVCVRR